MVDEKSLSIGVTPDINWQPAARLATFRNGFENRGMSYFSSVEGLDGHPESEIRAFLKVLGVSFPIQGRDIGEGYFVSPLNGFAANVFRAHGDQAVLLSYRYKDALHPLSIFFIESESFKFGHSTMLLPEYSDSILLEILQSATRRFFAKKEDELISCLNPDWANIELTNVSDRRIFWNQILGKEFRPDIEEAKDLPKIPVFPSVYHFNNPYFKHLLEIAVPEIQKGSRVLVMGVGAGLDAVIVARKTATIVDAVDVNPLAVLNSTIAAVRAGLSEYINVWQSDLFSDVHEKYDAIVFNAPLVVTGRSEDINRFDLNGGLLRRLVKDSIAYLNPKGRVYLMTHPTMEGFVPAGLTSKLRRHFKAVIEHGIHEVSVDETSAVPSVHPRIFSSETNETLRKS